MRDAELLAILDAGPVTPADLAFLSRQRRKSALLGIEALIDVLDALDAAGADLEPDFDGEDGHDDEHSLGAQEVGHVLDHGYGRVLRGGALDQRRWCQGSMCSFTSEAEAVDEDGGDINDLPHDEEPAEPSLGSLDRMWDQRRWNGGYGWDGERDGWRRPSRTRRVPPPATPRQIGNLRVIGCVS